MANDNPRPLPRGGSGTPGGGPVEALARDLFLRAAPADPQRDPAHHAERAFALAEAFYDYAATRR